MIIADTSGLLVAADSSHRQNKETTSFLSSLDGPLLLSPFVLAELDYLIGNRVGRDAQIQFLEEVEQGAYRLEQFDSSDIGEAREVLLQYPDLDLGLTDASLVVLAHRYGTHDILTLDQRHFRVVRGPGNRPFRILPADASD